MYNNSEYNESLYNETWLYLDATEVLGSSDFRNEVISQVKTEVISVITSLSKYLNNNPYLDDVFVTDDDIKNKLIKMLSDNTSLTDTFRNNILKTILETLTLLELRQVFLSRHFVDSLVLVSSVTKSISDKMLKESILLQSWLSVKKTGSHWRD